MYESKRLLLRNWTASDLVSLDAILGDPEVMKFSDTGVFNKPDQQAWLKAAISSYQSNLPLGIFAIQHRRSGQVLGYVSLSRDLSRVGYKDVEIGVRLVQSAWGQGYATEAIKRLIDEAKSTVRIVAIVDPNNHRSARLLKNAGFIHECDKMLTGYDYPDHLYVQTEKPQTKKTR